jgi:hypothetical protein
VQAVEQRPSPRVRRLYLLGHRSRLGVVMVVLLIEVVDVGVQALHVVVVRALRLADVRLVADNRYAVLAERAIHVAGAVQGLVDAAFKRVEQ